MAGGPAPPADRGSDVEDSAGTGVDREAVRRCLRQEAWQPYALEAPLPTLLDVHQAWLVERASQVRYAARLLWQELRAQRGFEGSYEVVKRAVRPRRGEAGVAALTQRRDETDPGEQAQVDWRQVMVMMGGVRRPVHIFVMTLGYIRRGLAEGFCDERMANLLSAHERAFAHFGGCCETLLYDRMRTVSSGEELTASGEWRARFDATFAAFAQHWGFTPRLCRPYRAQTKGKVESGVKYVKSNFLPGRSFHDLDDLDAQLVAWHGELADVRVHGTTHQLPIDRFLRRYRRSPRPARRRASCSRYSSRVEAAHEPPGQRGVEVRDLSVYEQLLDRKEVA